MLVKFLTLRRPFHVIDAIGPDFVVFLMVVPLRQLVFPPHVREFMVLLVDTLLTLELLGTFARGIGGSFEVSI